MALYAYDENGPLFAADALPGVSYRCMGCSGAVRVRRGRDRFPHFYHLQRSPACRLYSKSEDHLLLQLQLQKLLSKNTAHIERPFFQIHRISDLIWEKENIAFEIQCSSIDVSEAKKRILDYGRAGYRVVWLLDDRVFNRRSMRDAELFLRTQNCYFFTFQRSGISQFYDQMEIVIGRKRFRKSVPLKVDLSHPRTKPFLEWPPALPLQVQERIKHAPIYFPGDLIHKTIEAAIYPMIAFYLEKWKTVEIELLKANRLPSLWRKWYRRHILWPLHQLLDYLIRRLDQ